MSHSSEESTGRGCAAFINLILSAIILLVLAVFLLPDFIQLPDWFSNYVDVTKVEKRKVWGKAYTFPLNDPRPRYVLFLNTRPERKKITKIIKEKNPEKFYEILLTCKKIGKAEVLWEKKLGHFYPNGFPEVTLLLDSSSIYAAFQKDIWAYTPETGKEKWHIQLNEALPEGCTHCVQLDQKQKVMLLQTHSNRLKGIDLITGMPLWEKNFPATISQELLNLQPELRNSGIILFSMNSGNAENQWIYINTLSGKEVQSVALPQNLKYTILHQEQLYLLFTQKNQDFIEKIQLPEGKSLWKVPLTRETILKPAQITLEDFYESNGHFYKIGQDPNGRYDRVIKIENNTGKSQMLYETRDYELKFLHEDARRLYIQAWNKSKNSHMELWCIEKDSGKILWTFLLDASLDFLSMDQNLDLQLHTERRMLYCIQGLKLPRRLQVSVLDVTQGTLLRQQEYQVEDAPWTGVQWLEGKAYLTIGDLYLLDFEELILSTEWP
ncbi:MAG: PQQ-binding-like beta-propeller repeat protein [Microscillaceae bacterium]|nr:PQQ-binding-like beta-propeller repeat protein [Microscillaceae bacterium]